MNDESTRSADSIDSVLRQNPQLNDQATLEGLESLLDKLAPLLQTQQLHNLVDAASALSDVVGMADEGLINKVAADYENFSSAAFHLNNSLRYAGARVGAEEDSPSLWKTLRRLNSDEDARRGLAMAVDMLSLLGRDARRNQEMTDQD